VPSSKRQEDEDVLRRLTVAATASVLFATSLAAGSAAWTSSPQTQDQESDVLVVGAGISGLAAALEAGRQGAKVHVIDMWSIFGGHAVLAGGVLNIVGTPVQEALGIEDSIELAYSDFMSWGEDPDPEWVRFYVDHSRELIYDWLIDMGVEFGDVLRRTGNSVPRIHRTQGGRDLVETLYRECLRYPNITFTWNHKVTSLVKEDNQVVGVWAENLRSAQRLSFPAAAVVLATGGFQSNLQMVREFWPDNLRFPDRLLLSSGINALGSGHALAQEVGGVLSYMDHQWNYSTAVPDPRYPDTNRGLFARSPLAIWVNVEGKRFVSESESYKVTFPAVVNQESSSFWAVFDQEGREQFQMRGTTGWDDPAEVLFEKYPELVKKSPSIEELATTIGVPPGVLKTTVDRYNSMVKKGKDEDFGRFDSARLPSQEILINPHDAQEIEQPPFYALRTFPVTRKSMGGVLIDVSGRVLDRKGNPIKGLYGVGELTGFGRVNGKAGLEGTFLGPSIVTGRVGARTAVAELEHKPAQIANKSVHSGRSSPETDPSVDNKACLRCHNLPQLVAAKRPGYDHFERAHGLVLERQDQCVSCHTEFVPVDMESHRFDRVAQVDNCQRCH
jgi:flavocytochrome c